MGLEFRVSSLGFRVWGFDHRSRFPARGVPFKSSATGIHKSRVTVRVLGHRGLHSSNRGFGVCSITAFIGAQEGIFLLHTVDDIRLGLSCLA